MESDFLAAVDAAVAQALPADWPRVPHHRLPACGGTRARHAFRRRGGAGGGGPESYLAIVAAPPVEPHAGATEGELAALVELVLARGAGLLLLYEARSVRADWILDHLAFPHPRLLALACAPHPEGVAEPFAGGAPGAGGAAGPGSAAGPREACAVEPTWSGPEPLSRTIRDLWTGALFYDGPLEGPQTAGVEVLRDVCWRCCRRLSTVTGIVFPDREVADWSHPDWRYYQQLAELAALPDSVIAPLADAVDAWRAAGETRLTPIRWRYSRTVANSYWAAECPGCGAFRGAVPVLAERLPKLASLDSRRTGALSYRPLHLDVPRQLLHDLIWACEITPHARPLGWRRTGESDPRDAPATVDLAAAGGPASAAASDGGPIAAILLTPSLTGARAAEAPLLPPPLPARSLDAPATTPAGPWRRLGQTLAAWLLPRRSA